VLVTPEAVDMAHQLIDAIGVAQAPHIPDVTAQAVGQFVDQKSGGVIHNMQAEPKATNAVDIMSQLMKSIDEKKNAPKWGAPTGVPLSIPAPA
jgi:non-homologous end joining protein Ku